MRYLFCNIGWMETYKGNEESDQISSGGSYVVEEETGHEVCNFYSYRNKVYGYVQPVRGGQIKLERIVEGGASRRDESLDDVFVIWIANHPEGRTFVVGWYENATVFREYQFFDSISSLHQENEIEEYRIQANSKHAQLIPVDERTIEVRRGKGGVGQSNVWYADHKAGESIALKVLALSSEKGGKRKGGKKKTTLDVLALSNEKSGKRKGGKRKTTDPEHNKEVEKAAVDFVRKYYKEHGYTLKSVEKDNVGWDLEAVHLKNKTKLKIEVKGLSGKNPAVELSPNEYSAFLKKDDRYRLAVVTSALLKTPTLQICQCDKMTKTWKIKVGKSKNIKIGEKVSAQITLRI